MSAADVAMLLAVRSIAPPSVADVRADFAQLGDAPSEAALDRFGTALTVAWVTGTPGRGRAWRPEIAAPREEWREWFAATGYLHVGLRLPRLRPRSPLVLYRAATPGHERGMAWTPDRSWAEMFQAIHAADGLRSTIWTVRAEPGWVLAKAEHPGGNIEYVLDLPDSASVVEVPPGAVPGMSTWGRSAAGLLIHDRGRVLLQRRSSWVQQGGTWSIPAGAVERGETSLQAALREVAEECGIGRDALKVSGRQHRAEPVEGWRFTTHVARLRKRARGVAAANTWESSGHEWVPIAEVARRPLHPGFAASWPDVRDLLPDRPVRVLFVCAGNICRSPTAELLLRRMAADAGVAVEVASGGVAVGVGRGMDPGSLAEAARHGLDGSGHRARHVSLREIGRADLIVALDREVGETVRRIASTVEAAAVVRVAHVPNPWRGSAALYEVAYRAITPVCADVLDVVRSLERSRP
ncbi:NUDIX domain-containing protein [Microbacterium sp. NPDC057650]|uniref:arsenate reductase/protein-tyrosine-phosphatase family protein n=1 Tax=unclassified Microbacterium TaxID=2609290 RepID=UPI0036716B83